jgi:hypothetical protein
MCSEGEGTKFHAWTTLTGAVSLTTRPEVYPPNDPLSVLTRKLMRGPAECREKLKMETCFLYMNRYLTDVFRVFIVSDTDGPILPCLVTQTDIGITEWYQSKMSKTS